MRPAALVIAGCLMVGSIAGCKGAARYSDEAIQAVKTLLRTSSEDGAIQILEDAARTSNVSAGVVERAAIAWSRRVVPIRDRILSGLTGASPDDAARVRAFVVGSACDAFREAPAWPNGVIPDSRIVEIIQENRLVSALPPIVGLAELIADLTSSIREGLSDGDLDQSAPGVAQALACAVAAG